MKIIATTTWNSHDIVETFIRHYRKLGFDQMLVMDFDSTDGTNEIIRSDLYRDFIRTIPFPKLGDLDSSRLFLEQAKRDFDPETDCLFCDPDELLVLPEGTGLSDLRRPGASAAILPRFNVTGRLSSAQNSGGDLSPLGTLNLRIQKPSPRKSREDMRKDVLVPPWIYTALPGKVLVRLGSALSIGDGDHSAIVSDQQVLPAPDGVYLLHFPFRSYEAFEEKVRLGASDFAANPHSAETYGWQIRRWLRIAQAGNLRAEYWQQFVPDEQVERLIADGTLALDNSIKRLHAVDRDFATSLTTREQDRRSP